MTTQSVLKIVTTENKFACKEIVKKNNASKRGRRWCSTTTEIV